ncbi:MAG: hypothetical protein CMO01_33135 [Thalassobius sp.]|nr:hypothetical protein [Thalassovita sp.]
MVTSLENRFFVTPSNACSIDLKPLAFFNFHSIINFITMSKEILKDSLNIVELEERHEMTAVAADADRCIYSEK